MFTDVSLEDPRLIGPLLAEGGFDRMAVPAERLRAEDLGRICGQIHAAGKDAVLSLPFILRDDGVRWLKSRLDCIRTAGFDGYLVRNIDTALLLKESGLPGKRIFDAGIYTWNSVSAEMMRGMGADELTLPYELNLRELRERGISPSDTLVAYGRIPLMISAQCTKKNTGRCLKADRSRENGTFSTAYSVLTDRKGADFIEDSRCGLCYTVIYNSVPLWLFDKIPADISRIRIDLTDEGPEKAVSVIRAAAAGAAGPSGGFTRGHFTRGVE